MSTPILIHIGKDRRIAIPAQFCQEANIHPGDGFLLRQEGNQLVLTPLTDEAEQVRRELRELVGEQADLMADLRDMRAQDAADEAVPH
jgi:bifunctional DNA-binding transcriptional regulator/antitoxin component of YhaV-PrlF toxin-antitoxin module